MDIVIQLDASLFAQFKDACETIGVAAIDYLELKVSEIIENYIHDVASAPGIDDPRCHINPGDE